jgi:hypothetical protein
VGAKPSAAARAGSNVASFKFLVKNNDKDNVEQQDAARDVQRFGSDIHAEKFDTVERREDQLAEQHGIGVEMHVACEARDENDGNAEDGGKDQTNGGVFAHQLRAVEQLHEDDGDDAHQRRADKQQRRVETLCNEERDDDAKQNRVADGVAHHCHAAQHEEDARQCARDCNKGSDDHEFQFVLTCYASFS